MRGLSLVAASGGHSSSRCAGLSLSRPLLLRSTSSRSAGSVVVAHGPSCSAACGIFPDQGSNPCPLHWQADSQQLRHQGSPLWCFNLYLHGVLLTAYPQHKGRLTFGKQEIERSIHLCISLYCHSHKYEPWKPNTSFQACLLVLGHLKKTNQSRL